MVNLLLKIYDYFRTRQWLFIITVVIAVVVLISRTLTLDYKEDIYDFLPIESDYQKSLNIFQNISSAEKIFIVFQHNDSTIINQDNIVEAMECFHDLLLETDSTNLVKGLTISIDLENYRDLTDNIYENIPYFLSPEDYNRIDSLLTPSYIKEQVKQIKTLLLLPTGGLLTENIQKDPLNLFTPTVAKLQSYNNNNNYELYDGYIFTPNKKKSIAMLNSPYGSSETANNGELINYLNSIIKRMELKCPEVTAHLTGAPVIAVGNANQIKKDSIFAVIFASISIFALLLYSFRNIKSLVYIGISIIFGWLFAMAGISIINSQLSIIVIGISSVFIGIAVNYPLHLIAHVNHRKNIKESLKEIIPPLIVGNITTVGAFLCLIPLKSTALRDLGLFGAFMLIGTILFVVIFLPQIIGDKTTNLKEKILLPYLDSIKFENKKWVLWSLVIITVPMMYFSTHTKFDAEMQNINFMTDEQKQDFNELQATISNGLNTIYLVSEDSTLNGALEKCERNQKLLKHQDLNSNLNINSIANFYPSISEQKDRINAWNEFIIKNYSLINIKFKDELRKNGFNEEAFSKYFQITDNKYQVGNVDFSKLLGEISKQHICEFNDKYYVVDKVNVPYKDTEDIKSLIKEHVNNISCFDVKSMNNAISQTLSDEFDYIGLSCGFIVFIFLWLSLGRIELSIMAFLPMAISWIWILGIMGITGIQFNIVNVILATFIFGQGDDYTIFMTEGLIDEHAYRKKLLNSYKNSIIMSALIMFLGIGCLIFTEHPALRSLAEVTIVGMFVVVITAYFIPPIVFKFLTFYKGKPRKYPLTLDRSITSFYSVIVYLIEIVIGLFLGFALFTFGKKTNWKRSVFHKYIYWVAKINCKCIYKVHIEYKNKYKEDFKKGSVIICNHQSILDSLLMMALYSKVLIVTNSKVRNNFIIHKILDYAGFYTTGESLDNYIDDIKENIENGFHVCVFPEGARSDDSILRFHKGAFYLAEQIKADIIPVIMHGANYVMPKGNAIINSGFILLEIGNRIKYQDLSFGNNYQERCKNIHQMYCNWYSSISTKLENSNYFKDLVKSRYFYKGLIVEKETSKLLNKYNCFKDWIDCTINNNNIVIINNGYGVISLLFSLVHKNHKVFGIEYNMDKYLISKNISYKPKNLELLSEDILDDEILAKSNIYLFRPTNEQIMKYSAYNIHIIK